MSTIFLLGATSFLVCMIMTPLCRYLASRFNLLDQPDYERKLHSKPVPRIGGLPIVLSYACALILVSHFAPSGARLYIRHQAMLLSLLPAAGIVFITGLLDDLFVLKPWQKLVGQLSGAALAVSLGTRIVFHSQHAGTFHAVVSSSWVSIPLSLIWLVGCTNAVNLIDGMDGLAAGVGLFATVSTLLVAIFTGNTGLLLATMPLAGCLLAFLYYNFNPASIFLGDSGSLTIGFCLGCFGLIWSNADGTLSGLVAPLMAFALPLLDVSLAISRRYLRRVPIFKGDRGHIHHMVLARGFKVRDTTLILYGVCAVAASLGLLQSVSSARLHGLVIAAFVVLLWAGVRYLDYIELGAARRFFSRQRVFSHVQDEIFLRDLGKSLSAVHTAAECWVVVSEVCADLRFSTVEMYLQGTYFSTDGKIPENKVVWKMTLPLGGKAYLVLTRTSMEPPPETAMLAIGRLQRELARKEHARPPLRMLEGAA